jgi:hypothetical protein
MRVPFARTVLAGLALAAAACGDDADTSRLTLRLTDAPGDVQAAVVTISEIYLQGENGRTVLRDRDTTVNLLDLANATADLVAGQAVPAGSYSQLRFVITGAYLDVEGEGLFATSPDYEGLPQGAVVTGALQTPSFSTSGVKVILPGDQLVVDGDRTIVLVDFDVSESFGKEAGNSGRWVMRPVIKGADITVSGSLAVTLAPAQGVTIPAGVAAVLTDGEGNPEPALLLTDGDADGTFTGRFNYLLPDDYTLTFAAPEGLTTFTVDPASQAVTVSEGGDATASATVTAAQ